MFMDLECVPGILHHLLRKGGRIPSQSHSTCLPSTLLRDGKLNPRDSRALYKKLRELRENTFFRVSVVNGFSLPASFLSHGL